MKRLTTTAAIIALTAGTAVYAQESNMDAAKDNADAAVQNAEQAMENTGDAIAQETDEAVAEGEQAMKEAGDSMAEAGDEMKQEAEEAGDAMAEAGTEMKQEAGEMAASVDGMFNGSPDGLIRTRDITGGAVYAVDADGEAMEWDDGMAYDTVSDDWDNVGEIEDIVLNADGSFRGIVAEVGGFLDIGDKHVLLEIDNAKFVPIDDGNYSVVTNMTKDQLMELQDIDEGPMN
ncbi:PRC-barrel domain-containing protein [Salipiger mangrovisoli]|uniref:PRC-barrel domain-containing protein n=1 Tax=Salipiger mangrovisoli TaxID=2865933 RepID=A0ABR9X3C1_9RHOB|nr:PRC-barrel domain-containing protein [Salipiger mangrovisoli]MBE9638083.1 PRC-barrel domain-containing protein [Salipiger mangrovisoli]